MPQIIFYPAASRGRTAIGWLNAQHAFNFAGLQDLERNTFGALIILNEHTIQPGKGFGTYGHQNVEIISFVLEGRARHLDSKSNEGFIEEGEVQIISAGTGITHSKYNYHADRDLKLVQVWIKPEQLDIAPEFAQMKVDDGVEGIKQIFSPDGIGGGLRLHQQAWMYVVRLPRNKFLNYKVKKNGNGVYVYLIKGQLDILGNNLSEGDAIGVVTTESFDCVVEKDALAIIIEVPMN